MVGDTLDAVILAAAGLNRLGRAEEVSHLFSPEEMLPAPGQGALAVEIVADAPEELAQLVRTLDHRETRAAVTAERAALAILDAGCAAPFGALATVDGDSLTLTGRVINARGSLILTERVSGRVQDAPALGRACAYALLGRGAAGLMRSSWLRRSPHPGAGHGRTTGSPNDSLPRAPRWTRSNSFASFIPRRRSDWPRSHSSGAPAALIGSRSRAATPCWRWIRSRRPRATASATPSTGPRRHGRRGNPRRLRQRRTGRRVGAFRPTGRTGNR